MTVIVIEWLKGENQYNNLLYVFLAFFCFETVTLLLSMLQQLLLLLHLAKMVLSSNRDPNWSFPRINST